MAESVPRHLLTRARRRAGVLIVLLGLVLAAALPSVVLATTASGTAGDTLASEKVEVRPSTVITWTGASGDRTTLVAATTDATPAPGATPKPGEPGSTETASGWVQSTPSPADSVVPLLLGAVVLVILVAFMAMSFSESTEARPTGH